ncbi:MAG: aspartate--tRNA ligase, partial [Chloroflexi bacterium]|nr:aspartate--tRNA ligase [Chloroflexota bacterium]
LVQHIGTKRIMTKPWPRIKYAEAMERFGDDKFDMRFGMELTDVSDIVAGTEYKVFSEAVAAGGKVKGIRVPGCATYSRKQLDELAEYVRGFGAKGLAWAAIGDSETRSSFGKFLSEVTMKAIVERLDGQAGDLLLFVADRLEIVNACLSRLRVELAGRLKLRDDDALAFCWVIDFPLFQWNEAEKRWDPSHHLFTSPLPEDVPLVDTDPGKARGAQYDLVCNNYEVGGGSIRIHRRELQEKIFDLIGLAPEVARERFGHMLEAFEYGTPPHGGIAPGIDRLTMVLAGEPNIREVIAFPKSQQAADLMAGAPSPAESNQLKELHIQIVDS